jgi:N-dimethylarginine dimethylaminohydrolase
LRNALIKIGHDVVVVPTSPVLSLFSGQDPGVICDNTFIPNNNKGFGVEYVTKWFEDHGYEIKKSDLHHRFTSGDVVFSINRANVWYGIGGSSLHFKSELDKIFEDSPSIVRGLELVDPKFKSLNHAFCPLNKDSVMWYPGAFSDHSCYTIETWYPHSIKVSEEDALALSCSSIVSKNKIIIPKGITYELINKLVDFGLTTITVDISEFTKLGLGMKSMALEVIE